ncbi:MFS transporter [Brevibacillus ginsengisoli]|uniref:MFS transporter n=1 Tax=Brevibacillus ginsengisoli TaxID=363854 RepID=UPI003CFA7F84
MFSRRLAFKLLISWVTLFVIGVDLFVVSPLLPTITGAFRISPEEGGWMVSLFSVMYVFFSPAFGSLSDKVGRKKLLIFGLLLFSLANVCTSMSTSYVLLLCSRIIAGISVAAVTPSIYAIIGDTSPEDKRASSLAIVNSGLLTAIWTGAPVGALLGNAFGWQSVFWILAAASVMLILANQIVWPPIISSKVNSPSSVKRTILIKSVLVTALWSMSVYGFYTYIGVGFHQVNEYTDYQVATLVMVYGVGALAGSLFGGKITDGLGAHRVVKASLAVMAVLLLFIGVFIHQTLFMYIFLAVFALSAYAFFPAQQSLLVSMYPNHRGTFLAWNSSFLYLGMTCGAGLGSEVLKESSFSALSFVCAGVAVSGFIYFTLMSETSVWSQRKEDQSG